MEQSNLYYFFQHSHSLLRWLVLAFGLIAFAMHLLGWINGRHYRKLDNRMGLAFLVALDLQLVLGLALHLILSPFTRALFSGEPFMKDPLQRFYILEHPILMLTAIALAHIGRSRQRRSDASHAKFRLGTIFFGLALILILAGIRW
ncbi:MAG: hypothetical protein RMK52_07110 [Chitinophagales bacterium]|nr:hypothetical protein [Chitinophagales bacterium]MDW8393999.1 hypothetical protein [Chitinophagales bacterium]